MEQGLAPGAEVDGRYVVKRKLGAGGMGQVYEAQDLLLGRPVAIKLLLPRSQDDERARERLQREGRAAARVQHRHVVRVYEVGSDGESDYLAMELLQGEDLHAHLERAGPLSIRAAFELFGALADALNAIHAARVVHRDLKPRNLFLAHEGSGEPILKVLDFGVAKSPDPRDRGVTRAGEIFGTLSYMPPEQLRSSRDADARSDLWSAGAIFYEALTGRAPYATESIAELALKFVECSCPLASSLRPEVPAQLSGVIARCMQLDPEQRMPSAQALRLALSAAQAEFMRSQDLAETAHEGRAAPRSHDPSSPSARRRRWPLFAAALVSLGGVAWGAPRLVSQGASQPGPAATRAVSEPSSQANSGSNASLDATQLTMARPISVVLSAQADAFDPRMEEPPASTPEPAPMKPASEPRPSPKAHAAQKARATQKTPTEPPRTSMPSTPELQPSPLEAISSSAAPAGTARGETAAGKLDVSEF